jgi:hypothetical protein
MTLAVLSALHDELAALLPALHSARVERIEGGRRHHGHAVRALAGAGPGLQRRRRTLRARGGAGNAGRVARPKAAGAAAEATATPLPAARYSPNWRAARSFMTSSEPPPITITFTSRYRRSLLVPRM